MTYRPGIDPRIQQWFEQRGPEFAAEADLLVDVRTQHLRAQRAHSAGKGGPQAQR
ncbi:hypothetical protein ACX80J_14295 [Arthrobacter sp. MDB2-24]